MSHAANAQPHCPAGIVTSPDKKEFLTSGMAVTITIAKINQTIPGKSLHHGEISRHIWRPKICVTKKSVPKPKPNINGAISSHQSPVETITATEKPENNHRNRV